jgi:retron-type reverse transcriptase
VLEPIFDVDMPAEQHAYRPNLSALTAVRSVDRLINEGHTRIIEADLADYFGSIPHADLLKSVARRVSDRHMLHLIKMWLEAPVEEDDGKGGKRRTTTARDTGRGVPQGAPISPLLANLYMRRFVLGWKKRGLETRFGAKIVAYADDCVPRTYRRKEVRCCARDGGRPSGAGRQGQAPNHRKLRRSRAVVVSVAEKAGHDPVRCGSERRAKANR